MTKTEKEHRRALVSLERAKKAFVAAEQALYAAQEEVRRLRIDVEFERAIRAHSEGQNA